METRSSVSRRQISSCLPLHPLEARVLAVLAEGPAHAYRIVQQLEARDAGWTTVLPANLYRRIRALSARGLIVATPEAEAPRGRRTFALTPLGKAVARAEAERLRDLLEHFASAELSPGRSPR